MATLNRAKILGNLGKDPETKTFENGGSVCSFSIATQNNYFDKEKNQWVDLPADWHNIEVSTPGLIKVCTQYLRKGSKVYIEGKIKTRSYEKDGITRYVTSIKADQVILMSGAAEATPHSHTGPVDPGSTPAPMDDDLPF